MTVRYYAHTLEGSGPEDWQELFVHLKNVAELAASFAASFGSADWGELAGWWHDIGKYAPDFQAYLMSFANDPEVLDASVTDGRPGRVDHSSAGAVLTHERAGGKLRAAQAALAMVIAGHHAGLALHATFEAERIKDPAKRQRLDAARPGVPAGLLARGIPDIPGFLRPEAFPPDADRAIKALRYEFWTRMLLSALIDADRLDTERFCDGKRAGLRDRVRGRADLLSRLLGRLDDHMTDLASAARRRLEGLSPEARDRAEAVLGLRARVLDACRASADGPPGRYSLTVPTGGGKTLAALTFALRHAVARGLRRVIVVIPFTSIIDQTARVYREALGSLGRLAVVEHHSNLDPARETYRNRLASENWDAPVVVTTSVQFFESLFARRCSALRKVHNIARSVVVFDEVQTLPHHLRAPIFDALNQLVNYYGVSALFCTATQPALGLEQVGRQRFPHLNGVTEVVPDVAAAFDAVRGRVEATFPPADAAPVTWEQLAAEVIRHPRALVIVHRRDDARDLCRRLPPDTFHLSALMCAAHRRDVLELVTRRLKAGGTCRVVATTLVEAGVDLDFPVVYRALGGVDAMAQAAGRCNREGRLCNDQGRPVAGRLILFHAPSDPPKGLRLGRDTTSVMLAARGPLDLFDPATYETYFRTYLADVHPDRPAVTVAREARNFPEVEERFRMIDEQGLTPVVVPYGDAERRLEAFRAAPGRSTLRALQPYLVTISAPAYGLLDRGGLVEPIHDLVRRLRPGGRQYDERFGLVTDAIVPNDPRNLIFDDLP